ncbi:FecR family protein [Polaromonas sp. YR568]|uniref:FecR family protein n=1 Tax=Polaromonas sp. YR568 TaxID=1855301 RepID=UPI003138352D
MKSEFPFKNTLLFMALAAAYPLTAAAAQGAGIAQFASGEVLLRRSDGQSDPLVKGRGIESGQAIVTGTTGRAQVKFTDGGLVSLQPNTEFKITNYVDQADPRQDRFLVDLLRGSMRAITGLIGKRNRENYKVMTTTATIGIRGSGFNAGYNPDGSLTVTAEFDAIEVCNAGNCVGLTAGESVQVLNKTDPPVRTNTRAPVPTPPPEQEPVVTGNNTDSAGKAVIVASQSPTAAPISRTFSNIAVVAVSTNSSGGAYSLTTSSTPTSVFSDNKLVSVQDGTTKLAERGTALPVSNFKSVGNVTDANFIGWGMWTAGQQDYFGTTLLNNVHYIAGRPTAQTEINTLMAATGSATYTLVGSTAPTLNGVAGTLNSASFTISFGSTAYNVNTSINTSFGNFTDAASSSSAGFSGAAIKGLLIGTNASFAGLTYNKDFGSGVVSGALAFQK